MLIRIPVKSSALLYRHWDPRAPLPSIMAERSCLHPFRASDSKRTFAERDSRSAAEKEGYHSHPRFWWSMAPIPYPDGSQSPLSSKNVSFPCAGVAYMKFGDSADFWGKEVRDPDEVNPRAPFAFLRMTPWHRSAPGLRTQKLGKPSGPKPSD